MPDLSCEIICNIKLFVGDRRKSRLPLKLHVSAGS